MQHFTHVVLLLDGDRAGQEGAKNAVERLAQGMFVKAVRLPEGSQPDCEHHSAACRGRSVTLVGAGGWWPDPQLD